MPFIGRATPVPVSCYIHPDYPGRKCSGSGAHPGEGWVIAPNGFDIQWQDGTVGRMQPTFTTMQEAEDWAEAYNATRDQRIAESAKRITDRLMKQTTKQNGDRRQFRAHIHAEG